ncbi:MAG: hypothetical protein ACRYG7_47065 [Janthinobacterium lividum]
MTNLCQFPSLLTLLLLLASLTGRAQKIPHLEAKEQFSRTFTLPAPAGHSTLAIYNISGSVTVQGYAGSEILVEATKTIQADDAGDLATGQREAQPGFAQHGDSVVVYVAAPFDSHPGRNRRNEEHGHVPYHYAFDWVVKVPYQLQLHVSTVNEGAVRVLDVTGALEVSNINGGITLTNVRGTTRARTVNGNVDATYAASPPSTCSYRTVNGQIRVQYPASLGATAYFKSLHGEFYTDFAATQMLPPQVIKNQTGQGSGTVYRLTKETAVRIGPGGPDLRFETLNGSVTISQR